MRATLMFMMATALCVGCARRDDKPTAAVPPNKPKTTAAAQPADTGAKPLQAAAKPSQPPTEDDEKPALAPDEPVGEQAVTAARVPVEPGMSKDQITALVRSIVAEQIAERDKQQAAARAAEERQIAEEARTSIVEDERKIQQEAEKEAAERQAAEIQAALAQDQELASYLLLPDERDRVEQLKKKLATEDIWGLTLQELDFAATGFAAPLLHDALHEAAERYDSNIEMDVLAREADLTPEEKIEMATMQPIERQQLLMFTEQFKDGKPSVAAYRYIREYMNRYPFIRKIVLAYLDKSKPSS